jgi:hypothetical protein
METTFGVGGSQQGILLNFDAPIFLLTSELGSPALRWDNFRHLYAGTNETALDWGGGNFPRTSKTTSNIYQNDFYVSAASQSAALISSVNAEATWWSGHTIEGTPGNITVGDVCRLNSGTNTWVIADFNDGRCTHLLSIYVGNNKFLLDGHVVGYSDRTSQEFVGLQDVTSANYSEPLYGNINIAGFMQNGVPTTTGQYVRILGHAYKYTSDEKYYLVFFRPSNDFVLL